MDGYGENRQRNSGWPAVLIVNTRSRLGADYFHSAHKRLRECGVNLVRSYPIEHEADLARAVRVAIEEDIPQIIVGGGDGTLSSVADLLAYHNTVLGVLPLGTGNDFTRTLGIPADLEQACDTIVRGDVETINLAHIDGRYFLNTALIGFPGRVNRAAPDWLKRIAGKAAYAFAAAYSVIASPPFRASIAMDGLVRRLETKLVVVGNGRFYTPSQVEPLSECENLAERLIVQAPRDASTATMIRLAYDYGVEGRLDPELLTTVSGRDVLIETDPPQEIDVDGETAGWTPTRATIAPRALRVIVPAEAHRLRQDSEPPIAA